MRLLFLSLFTAAAAIAQNAAGLLPVPYWQPTVNGVYQPGAQLCSFAAGTTTPQATYTDATGTVANTNPQILDSNGGATVWLNSSGYKFVLTTGGSVSSCPTGGTVIGSWDQVFSVFQQVNSLNTLVGTLVLAGSNGLSVTHSGSTITLALPQLLTTAGNVIFANLTVTNTSTGLALGGSGTPAPLFQGNAVILDTSGNLKNLTSITAPLITVNDPTPSTPLEEWIGNTSSYQNYYVDGTGTTIAGEVGFFTAGNPGMGMSNKLTNGSLYFLGGPAGNIFLEPGAAGGVSLGPGQTTAAGTVNMYDGTATTGNTIVYIREGAGQSGNPLNVMNNSLSSTLFGVAQNGAVVQAGVAFSTTSGLANGTMIWCTDCTVNTTPPYTCAGSGSGAWMFVSNAARKCPF